MNFNLPSSSSCLRPIQSCLYISVSCRVKLIFYKVGFSKLYLERNHSGVVRRRKPAKPFRISWIHDGVLVELYQHKVVDGEEVVLVGGVLDRSLVVDIRQVERVLLVLHLSQGVVPVLGLDEDVLDPANIGAIVEKSPHVVTQPVVLPQALGQAVHSLLGSSDGDQVVNPRLRTSLGQTANEEAALGKSDRVVAI